MDQNTPLSPRPLPRVTAAPPTADVRRRVLTSAQLRERGVTVAQTSLKCRPGGPWQPLLPGVFLLRPGPPTSEERLHAALLYASRPTPRAAAEAAARAAAGGPCAVSGPAHSGAPAMITGLAALTLHGFSASPPLLSLDRIDVLVPRTRRLRSVGFARLVRTHEPPTPQTVTGLPVAPVARALADAVARLSDAETVRVLLTEAVRGGHCEAGAVVRELRWARLLSRPYVVRAVDALLAEGRTIAEDRLYAMVAAYGLPEPLWNVDLRLEGGPHLGGVDAYWPEQAVALELDTRTPRHEEEKGTAYARKREHLERLGLTVVNLTPKKLRDAPDQQATVVRTALMAAVDREPAAYVVVLPR